MLRLLGVLSLATWSVAQSCSGTTTVTAAPSGCSTWTGDIVIPTDLSSSDSEIRLNGLERVDGSLIVDETLQLTTLSSNSLHTITDMLQLSNLQILSTIDFAELTSVETLEMVGLPNLQQNSLLDSLTSLSNLTLINTQVQELVGFGLETIEHITITNNPYLNSINLQPYNVTGVLMMSANGRELEVSMPNVESAQNITFANCSGISIPSLRSAFSLTIMNNFIDEFNGAPLLHQVNASLAFVSNENLERIALPELRNVSGGIIVNNNTALRLLEELYSLDRVDGAISLEGPFENVTFPALERVTGAFQVNSTSEMSCDSINEYYTSGVVAGRYSCITATDSSNSSTLQRVDTNVDSSGEEGGNADAGNGGSDLDSSGESGGISTGARIGIGVGVGLGVGTLVGGLVGLWFHRRNNKRQATPSSSDDNMPEKDGSEVDRANMLGNDVQKFELEHPVGEMGTGAEAQELPAQHGMAELGRNNSTKKPLGVESRHEMPADSPPRDEKGGGDGDA